MSYTIIAGGKGLIGAAIYDLFERDWWRETIVLDLPHDDVGDYSVLEYYAYECGTIDAFINTTYPRTMEKHIRTYLNATKFMAEKMRHQKNGGVIINMSSIYGVVGSNPSLYEDTEVKVTPIEYSASKGAIIGLTKQVATQYGKYNVRANTVSPGGVFDNQDPKFVERYNKNTPMGKMATPEDIAKAVYMLERCDYITGQNIVVDGGYTAW